MVRRPTALAALVAASLFLSPSAARAQFYFSGPGGFFANPGYIAPAYRSSYLYYQVGLPYNPVLNNPFGYGGASAASALMPSAPPVSGTLSPRPPVVGVSGFSSYLSPFGSGGLPSYAGFPS